MLNLEVVLMRQNPMSLDASFCKWLQTCALAASFTANVALAAGTPSKASVWIQRGDMGQSESAMPRLDARDEVGTTVGAAPFVSFEIGKRVDQVDKKASKPKIFRGRNWVFAGVGAGRGLFWDGRGTAFEVEPRRLPPTQDELALRLPDGTAEGPLRSMKVCSGDNGIEAITLEVTGARSATYTIGSPCTAWRKPLTCPAGTAISGVAVRWSDATARRSQEERAKVARQNQLAENTVDFIGWQPRFPVDISAIRCSDLR